MPLSTNDPCTGNMAQQVQKCKTHSRYNHYHYDEVRAKIPEHACEYGNKSKFAKELGHPVSSILNLVGTPISSLRRMLNIMVLD